MAKRVQLPVAAKRGGVHGKRYRGAARRPANSKRRDGKSIVTVRLSEFAREALAGEQEQGNERLAKQVVRAIRCYLKDKAVAGPGWAYPAFLREKKPVDGEELEVSIDDSLWHSLEREASSQNVSVRQMLDHAVFYFAAEISAGRLTERILSDLDEAGTA
jgi:hypothetical protein